MAYPSMNASYVSPHSKHPLFSFPVPLECASLVFQLFRIRSSRALHPLFFFLPRWIYYYLLQGKNMRLVFRSRIGSCEKLLILRDIIESALITFSFSERQLKICWPLSFFLKKRKQFKNSDRGIIWLFQFVTNMSRVSQSYAFHLGCHETVT